MFKPFVYQNQNQDLLGILHSSEDIKKPMPAIIMCHGFRGSKIGPHRMFVSLANKLLARGIASFRFDFRGSGDSEGDFNRKTISGEIFDTMKTIEFLKQQEEIDEDNIFLLGFSLGGTIAACAAARNAEINNLILWSSIAQLDKFFFNNIFKDVDKKTLAKRSFVQYQGYRVGAQFLDELKLIKPLDEIKAYQGGALIVHSREDDIVPVSHAFSYYENLPSENKELLVIKDGDHNYFDYKHEKEVIYNTVDWIASQNNSN